jgi:hypothetical protein
MRMLRFSLAFVAVLAVAWQGLGYRHLWQDEVETAERARSVLAYGVPKTIDPRGNWSINTGGREIEETDLHRYTPWAQFYVAAAGLAAGRALGAPADLSVRAPFAVLHAASSGLVAAFLPVATGIGGGAAVAIGIAYGLGSVRLIHDRTSRYHALNDFLFLSAWIAFGALRRRRPGEGAGAALLLGACIAGLLHSQTLMGLLAAGFFAGLLLLDSPRRKENWIALAPALAGFAALVALTRPWEQAAIWGSMHPAPLRSLKNNTEIGYVFVSLLLGAALILRGRKRELRLAVGAAILVQVGVRVLDFHPLSQTRYYFPIIGAFLFWPLAIGSRDDWDRRRRWIFVAILAASLVIPEGSRKLRWFAGLRNVAFERKAARESGPGGLFEQPLMKAISRIRTDGRPGEGVLAEYVSQFVNWYLPEFRPALVPDPTALSHLGRRNAEAIVAHERWPEWHLAFPVSHPGFWKCEGPCDVSTPPEARSAGRYVLRSRSRGTSAEYCRVDSWETTSWNNSPLLAYPSSATSPEGERSEVLVLARRCDLVGR